MKKITLLFVIIITALASKAQNDNLNITNLEQLKAMATLMNASLPIEIPGMGSMTKVEVTQNDYTTYFTVNQDIADILVLSSDKEMKENGLKMLNNESAITLMEEVTNLGLNYKIVYILPHHVEKSVTITAADVRNLKAAGNTPESSFINMVENINDNLDEGSGVNSKLVTYDDDMMYVHFNFEDVGGEENFLLLQLSSFVLEEEDKAELFKEVIDENAILGVVFKLCATTGRGVSMVYYN